MIKHFIFIAFLVVSHINVFGQLIDNSQGNAFKKQPFFSQDFLIENKIKSISGKFLYYQLGDEVRETDYYQKFIFDKTGKLISEELKDKGFENKGILFTEYKYDSKGNVVSIISQNKTDIFGYFFQFDSNDREIKREYRQNIGNKSLGLGKEYTFSLHRFEYEVNENKLYQTAINESGLPYLNTIKHFDEEDGKLLEIEETQIRNNIRKNQVFSYDESGNLTTITTLLNNGKNKKESEFLYDDAGKLISSSETNDGAPFHSIQIIYKTDSEFINDVLIKDEINYFIKIFELRNYEFY